MKRKAHKMIAFVLSWALLLSVNGIGNITTASAAAKAPKLSKSSISIKVNESKKVTLKNKPSGAKVTWVSKDKTIATVKSGKITGKKVGSTQVVCKVVYKNKGKKVTKKPTVKVKVTAAETVNPTTAPTATPVATPAVEISNLTTEHKSQNGITTKDNGQMRKDLTAAQLMKFMGQGWNLGNTLEACGAAEDTKDFTTAKDFELFWNKIETTQKTMDGIHSYGVNSVRIPVAWSNMMSDDGKYTINEDYFNRVEEVLNYVLNNEMYAIINIHYDSEWWGQFGDKDEAVRQQAWDRYEAFWTQIAERYKEYSDRLIFESANEELGDPLVGNWRTLNREDLVGVLSETERYEVTKQINQKFVDIVRASGGNNKYRQLLIAGYNTDIDKTCDTRFVMPTDISENGKNKLSVSVHYYTPSTYCIAEAATNSWGYSDTWGTKTEVANLHTYFDKMSKFTKEGYGVIIGEYGVCSSSKDGIPQFIKEVMTYGAKLGFVPMLWDTGLWYDRSTGEFTYKDVAEVFNEVTGSNGVISDKAETTGIVDLTTVSEDSLTKLYTWEGYWTRTGNASIKPGYEQTSCDEGLNVQTNADFWQLWVNADWSKMTTPCIKIYMAADSLSQNADIQIGYAQKADGSWKGQINPQTNWIETCIPLDTTLLADYPWIMLSSSKPGVTIVKIEIFDAK